MKNLRFFFNLEMTRELPRVSRGESRELEWNRELRVEKWLVFLGGRVGRGGSAFSRIGYCPILVLF